MEIPSSLCDGARLLLAPDLCTAYLKVLNDSGLTAIASEPRPSPAPVGGITQAQTDLHFAHAFDGSVARAQLALLDPLNEVGKAAETLRLFLSGGGLCLADVPSGAGAAALSLLCTAAELRRRGILPREPLNVHLLWGEISEPAREYAEKLLNEVNEDLAGQAIFVEKEIFSWDVLSKISNAELVEKIIIAKTSKPQTLLIISNFNGFLEKENKKKAAYPQLEELFKFCSGKMNAAVWIEPNMNSAKKALFPWLIDKLAGITNFAKAAVAGEGSESCDYKFSIPIEPSSTVAVRLCVVPIDLVKEVK